MHDSVHVKTSASNLELSTFALCKCKSQNGQEVLGIQPGESYTWSCTFCATKMLTNMSCITRPSVKQLSGAETTKCLWFACRPTLFQESWQVSGWREEDREQCHLQNARQLWEYCSDRNRQALVNFEASCAECNLEYSIFSGLLFRAVLSPCRSCENTALLSVSVSYFTDVRIRTSYYQF